MESRVAQHRALKDRGSWEEAIRHNKSHVEQYLQYADWELGQGQPTLAVAILERCIATCTASPEPWLALLNIQSQENQEAAEETSMRAIERFPIDEKIWAAATRTCKNITNLRGIWAQWVDRDTEKMKDFIAFEQRTTGDQEIIRELYEHWTQVDSSSARGWLGLAHSHTDYDEKCRVYSRAISALFFTEHKDPPIDRTHILIEFAWVNRSRPSSSKSLADILESKVASLTPVEDIIVSRELARLKSRGLSTLSPEQRRQKYTAKHQPWVIIAILMQKSRRAEMIFVFEWLLSQIPTVDATPQEWKSYNKIALSYCLEREYIPTYDRSIAVSPFSFAPLCIQRAKLHLIQNGPQAARESLIQAQQKQLNFRVFCFQLALESELKNLDQGRLAYQFYLSERPSTFPAWELALAFEMRHGKPASVRALFDLALEETEPTDLNRESLFKFWVQYEVDCGNLSSSETVITRWFSESKSVDAWTEVAYLKDGISRYPAGATVFRQAADYFQRENNPSCRKILVKNWVEYEKRYGTPESVKQARQWDGVAVDSQASQDRVSSAPIAARMAAPPAAPQEPPKRLSLFEKAQRWKSS